MKVRTIITMNRGVQYRIDGIFYKHEMYIPEIIRDQTVETYGVLEGVVIIRTKRCKHVNCDGICLKGVSSTGRCEGHCSYYER